MNPEKPETAADPMRQIFQPMTREGCHATPELQKTALVAWAAMTPPRAVGGLRQAMAREMAHIDRPDAFKATAQGLLRSLVAHGVVALVGKSYEFTSDGRDLVEAIIAERAQDDLEPETMDLSQ